MSKLSILLCLVSFTLPVFAANVGVLTVRGPLEGRALTYSYGEPIEGNNLMDLNGQVTWETPFEGFKGGDAVRYDMMLSTESNGKFDSFTYVQVSLAPPYQSLLRASAWA